MLNPRTPATTLAHLLCTRLLMLITAFLFLSGCSDTSQPAPPDRASTPADWQTQVAITMRAAKQRSADPVLVSVLAHPTTADWATSPQTVPPLETAFDFADGTNPDPQRLAVTTVRFTDPPITGTVAIDPGITWETVSEIKDYAPTRLGMRDAFATMKAGPSEAYLMTASEGAAFVRSDSSKPSLIIGTLYVPEFHLDQVITPEKGQNPPVLVWSVVYSTISKSLRFLIDPYTGVILKRDTQ